MGRLITYFISKSKNKRIAFDFAFASKKEGEQITMSYNKIIFLLLICFTINSCTEPYILETNTYEEALIVEATITNELKKQEITLTKTSRFEDTATQIESGADVFITDNTGTRYNFEEESGKYFSTTEFQAIPGKEYQLNINTKDGRFFKSSTETLTPINAMQDVKAVVETKDSLRGVAIRVTSFDPINEAKYYRYEYEETYKIIAPSWNLNKAIVVPPDPRYPRSEATYALIPNSPDTRICYNTKKSTEILLTSTAELNDNHVNFNVRFISNQNYIIMERYSILVRQYIENLASYSYYSTLKKLSGSGSLLSPNQPGFLYGNLRSVDNPSDKIIGYFDVTSVSTKRIYFNYIDLFTGEAPPPYYTDCTPFCYGEQPCTHNGGLIDDIGLGKVTYSGSPNWVNAPCGDCTKIGSNIKPSFWED
ncbi:MAG TPA: DUF4249 domain-containing protein [Flavobacterium sp.]|uniref:DUF4249 domain-containing protein n=1 Tax=Flavobacterium sp. TaxID=239 RepID=UPI002DBA5C7A|nr:DUF4249 domain-containing protein [Flavobacterium sp.]HEU4790342.1 DUF4249 domain-containing protein [Flavobacterium sp.]